MAAANIKRRGAQLPRHRKADKSSSSEENRLSFTREAAAVFLVIGGVFVAASLYSYLSHLPSDLRGTAEEAAKYENIMGPVGTKVAYVLVSLLGWCSFVIVAWAFLIARTIWVIGWPSGSRSMLSLIFSAIASLMMVACCATIAAVLAGFRGGGVAGSLLAFTLVGYINEAGTLLVSSGLLLISLGITAGIGTAKLISLSSRMGEWLQIIAADIWMLCLAIGRMLAGFAVSGCKVMLVVTVLCWDRFSSLISALVRTPLSLIFPSLRVERTVEESRPIRRKKAAETDPAEEPFVLGEDRDDLPPPPPEDDDATDFYQEVISRRTMKARRDERARLRKDRLKMKKPKSAQAFQSPPLDLLAAGESDAGEGPKDEELLENCKRLEKTLADFRVAGKIVEVQPGPVITLYEFAPAAGVKVQRIVSLADDLALTLRAGSVRVYAPVPGKGTVGIEVPNQQREVVRLRDSMEEVLATQNTMELPLVLGKDTFGEVFVSDLARMPHLLIAGATGTGKSVCINSLLLSLLFRHSPEELRLLMIDPKMLELSIYEDIPHLKAAVVTNPKRARAVLWWAVEEMERRYRLMKKLKVRGLAGYNAAVRGESCAEPGEVAAEEEEVIELEEHNIVAADSEDFSLAREDAIDNVRADFSAVDETLEPLPRIVIVVDELADLMLTVGREIEELLTRLAQKARAAGIHLILATQRPSVNVITGLIKANFPARIAFKVASRIDSRTVLDTSGAEKLLGMGDMLFLSPGAGIKRLHSAYVSDKEVQDVVAWLREQRPPDYDSDIEVVVERFDNEDGAHGGPFGQDAEYDDLYDQAVRYVVEKGQASTSMVQRVFRIGYNRAARILDMMEREGIVGPADGAKPRPVLIPNREAV